MRQLFQTTAVLLATVLLSSCMLHSSKVDVTSVAGKLTGPRVVTFLKSTPYVVKMTVALAKRGFTVKAMPSQKYITTRESPGKVTQYNEASARYGLTLIAQPTGLTCAFTRFAAYHFTLIVTDIQTNQIVLVLKQTGSDGPCTTVKPVFPTLAEALSNAWQ